MDVETLVGEGLYNYYVEWVREHYPSFRPVLWFFRRGDKALGLIQLRKAAHYSMYSRVEAQTFLMKILLEEGKDIENAERMANICIIFILIILFFIVIMRVFCIKGVHMVFVRRNVRRFLGVWRRNKQGMMGRVDVMRRFF